MATSIPLRGPAGLPLLLLVLCLLAPSAEPFQFKDEKTIPPVPVTAPTPSPVTTVPTPAPLAPFNCASACETRCSLADRLHKRCLKYCNICCAQCSCVPSGSAGNKDECPCYRDKKNSRGYSKCP